MFLSCGISEFEPENKVLIGGNNYITGQKFKTLLNHCLLEWEVILEDKKLLEDEDLIFAKGMKLLGLEKEFQYSSLKDVYMLSNRKHVIMMMRNFFIYEPLSFAIFQLFNQFKYHFENLIKTFVESQKEDNWTTLVNTWSNLDEYSQSSSTILLYFNDKEHGIKMPLELAKAAQKFKYCGFCPKVPNERFVCLIKFPYEEFAKAIERLGRKCLSYNELFVKMDKKLIFPDEPHIPTKKRIKEGIKEWTEDKCMTEIFALRKELTPYCIELENHYIEKAKIIDEVTETIVKPFFKK